MLPERLVIHEQIDEIPGGVGGVRPLGKLVRRERKFGPLVVREPEGDVVREAVILEQKLEAIAPRRAVDEVRAAPAEHMIRTLGKHGLVAHRFHGPCQIVVVDKFRIAEDTGRYAEERFDPLVVQGDLFPELLRGIQKRQRMVVRLGKQFHASGGHQFPEALDDFRRVGLELIERRSGNGETDLEPAVVFADQLEQKRVHGQVAFTGHLQHDAAVRVLVLVKGVHADVEKGVVPQPVRLVDLKIETKCRHIIFPRKQVARKWRSDDRPRFPNGWP